MGTSAQSEVVFRRETGHVDPSEWSDGCFKSRDQLLPTVLLIFDGDTAVLSRGAAASIRKKKQLFGIQGNDLVWAIA
jgi:hypothetical protein